MLVSMRPETKELFIRELIIMRCRENEGESEFIRHRPQNSDLVPWQEISQLLLHEVRQPLTHSLGFLKDHK